MSNRFTAQGVGMTMVEWKRIIEDRVGIRVNETNVPADGALQYFKRYLFNAHCTFVASTSRVPGALGHAFVVCKVGDAVIHVYDAQSRRYYTDLDEYIRQVTGGANVLRVFTTETAMSADDVQSLEIARLTSLIPECLRKTKKSWWRRWRKGGMRLKTIRKSHRKEKKFDAVFEKNGREIVTPFGQKGYSDFTKHKDVTRRARYLKRHRGMGEHWNQPTTPGALSRWVLWNKRTLRASVADFKRRFRL
jgi:hypothetical protein